MSYPRFVKLEAQRLRRVQALSAEEIKGALTADKRLARFAHPPSDRTIRNWLAEADAESGAETPTVVAATGLWPQDRIWPDWTSADIRKRVHDWPDELIERTLFAARGAGRQRHRWVVWYLRHKVEVTEESRKTNVIDKRGASTNILDWVATIAGLELLAEWLDEPSARRITDNIRHYRPFDARFLMPEAPFMSVMNLPVGRKELEELGRRRQAYAPACRGHVARIRNKVEELAYEVRLGLPLDAREGPYLALAALLERLPMIDDLEGITRMREWGIEAVMMTLFRHEPPRVIGKQPTGGSE